MYLNAAFAILPPKFYPSKIQSPFVQALLGNVRQKFVFLYFNNYINFSYHLLNSFVRHYSNSALYIPLYFFVGKTDLDTFNHCSVHRVLRLTTEVRTVFSARQNTIEVEPVGSEIRQPVF